MSSEIYLVLAGEDYEAAVIIQAFTTKTAADSFAQKLRDYQGEQPEWPTTSEPDEVFEQKSREMDAWRTAHPGGEAAAWRRQFSVVPVPLVGGEA